MAESYSIILNSQNDKNRTGDNANSYTYYINWDSVLPFVNNKTSQSFKVTWTLKSINTTAILTKNSLVSVNLGKTNTFDQTNCQTNILGYIYPQTVGGYYYFTSSIYDNTNTVIQYPTNNFITVNFSDFNPTTNFVMINYVLILTFEAV